MSFYRPVTHVLHKRGFKWRYQLLEPVEVKLVRFDRASRDA
jgi:hypothetical protein